MRQGQKHTPETRRKISEARRTGARKILMPPGSELLMADGSIVIATPQGSVTLSAEDAEKLRSLKLFQTRGTYSALLNHDGTYELEGETYGCEVEA